MNHGIAVLLVIVGMIGIELIYCRWVDREIDGLDVAEKPWWPVEGE